MPLATSHLERGSDWTQSQYSQRARLLMRVFESVLIFTIQESFKEAEKEAKNKPLSKGMSINEEAMNRILRQQQLEQMETDLREMIIYQIGMPGLWSKFVEMREVVRKEREKIEREQKKPLRRLPERDGSLSTNGKFVERYWLAVYLS